MTANWIRTISVAAGLAAGLYACGGHGNAPTTPTPVAATLAAPSLDAPAPNLQMDSLRPTLSVKNATFECVGGDTNLRISGVRHRRVSCGERNQS